MVLDYILVYRLDCGIKGAAIATALSEVLGGTLPLIYFCCKNSSLLRIVRTSIDIKPLFKACYNGLSEMLTNISMSLVSMVYNFQLMRLSAENGVSAYGVIMYVSFIFMSFFFGYAIGINPIVGYNFGAQRNSELRNVLRKSLVLTSVAAVIITVASIAFALQIAGIFVGYDIELKKMTVTALRCYALSFLFSGFNVFSSAFFTGLNNGKISALISVMRTFVVQLAAVLILPMLFALNGIWFSVFVSEFVTLFVSVICLITNRKKYKY